MGLFQDSLKKWFYTNNTNAASSDARVPLLNANGTPKGSDTMANLASVLGGIQGRNLLPNNGVVNNGTLADISITCIKIVASNTYTPSDIPSGYANSIIETIVFDASNVRIQRIYKGSTTPSYAFRVKWYGDYSSWVELK